MVLLCTDSRHETPMQRWWYNTAIQKIPQNYDTFAPQTPHKFHALMVRTTRLGVVTTLLGLATAAAGRAALASLLGALGRTALLACRTRIFNVKDKWSNEHWKKHARNDDIMNVDIHDIYTDFSIHNAPTIVQWTLRKDVEKQHTVLYPGLDTSPWNTWNIVKSYCCPLSRCHGTALLGALAGRGTTTTLGCHGVWGATQSEQKRERTNTRYDERVHSSKNKNGRWEDTGLTNCKKTYWIYEDAFNFTIHYYTPQYKRFNIGIGNIIRHDMTNGIAAITMTEGDEYRYMYEYGKDTRLTITARNRALFGKIHSKYKYGIIFPNTWYDSKFHLTHTTLTWCTHIFLYIDIFWRNQEDLTWNTVMTNTC